MVFLRFLTWCQRKTTAASFCKKQNWFANRNLDKHKQSAQETSFILCAFIERHELAQPGPYSIECTRFIRSANVISPNNMNTLKWEELNERGSKGEKLFFAPQLHCVQDQTQRSFWFCSACGPGEKPISCANKRQPQTDILTHFQWLSHWQVMGKDGLGRFSCFALKLNTEPCQRCPARIHAWKLVWQNGGGFICITRCPLCPKQKTRTRRLRVKAVAWCAHHHVIMLCHIPGRGIWPMEGPAQCGGGSRGRPLLLNDENDDNTYMTPKRPPRLTASRGLKTAVFCTCLVSRRWTGTCTSWWLVLGNPRRCSWERHRPRAEPPPPARATSPWWSADLKHACTAKLVLPREERRQLISVEDASGLSMKRRGWRFFHFWHNFQVLFGQQISPNCCLSFLPRSFLRKSSSVAMERERKKEKERERGGELWATHNTLRCDTNIAERD